MCPRLDVFRWAQRRFSEDSVSPVSWAFPPAEKELREYSWTFTQPCSVPASSMSQALCRVLGCAGEVSSVPNAEGVTGLQWRFVSGEEDMGTSRENLTHGLQPVSTFRFCSGCCQSMSPSSP